MIEKSIQGNTVPSLGTSPTIAIWNPEDSTLWEHILCIGLLQHLYRPDRR